MVTSSPSGPGRWMRSRVTSRPDLRTHYYQRRTIAGGGVSLVLLAIVSALSAGSGASSEMAPPASSTTTIDSPAQDSQPTTTIDPCPAVRRTDVGNEAAPEFLVAAVENALANSSLTTRQTGASIWVEGYGEITAQSTDLPLIPASNQKMLTAMGVLETLDLESVLTTEIRAADGPDANGVITGDLWIVGGGDPLIKREGEHSLEDLASRMAAEGITEVTGNIRGDESRYDQIRKAPGWLEWEMPLPGGSQSALMVNSNSRIGDLEYLANPTAHNVDLFRTALIEAGISVVGGSSPGTAPDDSEVVFAYLSPTIAQMVETMLAQSDNMTAEMLTKEVGYQVAGVGSWEAGMTTMIGALEESMCLTIEGVNDDASGISRDNTRPVGNWVDLLLAARSEPWFPIFETGLPTAGEEGGTLANRFLGTPGVDNVTAKTGSLGTSVALSGYAHTEDDRVMVFSIVVNGDQPEPAVPAIDAVVVAAVSSTG